MIQHLTEIVDEARKRGKKRLAVAYGQDSHTLEAVYEAYKEGIVEPTLFGEKKVIEQVCAEDDIDIKAFNIVDEASDVKCVQQAVAAVVAGNADVLMKGLVSTDKYMRGILNKEAGFVPPEGRAEPRVDRRDRPATTSCSSSPTSRSSRCPISNRRSSRSDTWPNGLPTPYA